jgi:hypothetical protein
MLQGFQVFDPDCFERALAYLALLDLVVADSPDAENASSFLTSFFGSLFIGLLLRDCGQSPRSFTSPWLYASLSRMML